MQHFNAFELRSLLVPFVCLISLLGLFGFKVTDHLNV